MRREKVRIMPAKKKKMVSRSKLGTTFVTHGWGHDECRKLVEAVMKLGGKVPGWYTILAEKQEFRHRSAHSKERVTWIVNLFICSF